ncbi:Hypothetical predicted protein [Paramuricea clavata]|uniref:Uncharacterized protein n=1 Tax=Paramuricea clavata TaxID=317549 RepID=A0A7D9KGX2_PARCT|nr:Hypothetical predicted protein [Paramuricea clavata]
MAIHVLEGQQRYDSFVQAFRDTNPYLKKQVQFLEAQKTWNNLKTEPEKINKKIIEYKTKAVELRSKSLSFWLKTSNAPPEKKSREVEGSETNTKVQDSGRIRDEEKGCENDSLPIPATTSTTRGKEAPAQDKLKTEIGNMKAQLTSLVTLQNTGLSLVKPEKVKELKTTINTQEMLLKRRVNEAARQRKRRAKLKESIRVSSSASADRRRCEILRTVTTLDDLNKELSSFGFKIGRPATYLRLLPRRQDTIEGKRHVKTVSVKLLRPENTLRKANVDRMFAKSFVDDVRGICSLFGPDAVLFLSNYDKARVPLGLAAANLQAPIRMHLDYKVRLNDHSFVIGPRHTLIPSVYAVCEVRPNGELSYSGKTFIRVRNGKHDSSTAFTHAYDLRELFLKGSIPQKPILLMETDGAQDDAQDRLFTLSMLLERRMAPLSHDIAGVILSHDHNGNHLSSSGNTTDEELEKRNFLATAHILSEVWSNTVIDNHKVDCVAVPIGKEFVPDDPNPSWVANHVQQATLFKL